jgi:peptidyl-prolyl cis-trans isomerase SurA
MNYVRLAIVAVLVALGGALGLAAQSQGTIIQKIIVKVNGEILTQTELEQLQIDALRRQNQNRPVTERDLATDAGLRSALAEITPTLLADAVDELLLMQRGREMGLKFTDEQFKDSLQRIKDENKIDDKQLMAALQQEGLTMDELRQNFERMFMVNMVERREIMGAMTITEEESRQYYRAHPEEFMKPPTVTLREILVAVPVETVGGQQTVNVAADEAAKEKIAAVRDRALKGEDFLALINEVSQSGTKANGGMVGPVLVADLSPALAGMLEKMKPGDITEPFRTRSGYQIFKLETRTAAEPESFDKVRGQISQRISESRLGVERKKLLDRLRVQALIEWKDEAYKKYYEQGLALRAKAGSGSGLQ